MVLKPLINSWKGHWPLPLRKLLKLFSNITGRLIVTGMGKSGHIGSKMAATFASTGTPAFFVHPAEANHGDLGMIARDDAILAMSWSGEASELEGILTYSRRFKIPLVAVTSKPQSTLAKQADICLVLPREEEACPHGLAPTTSTVMQLALGDALAISLLESRGFSPTDFKTFHPGGQLGANLTQIRDLMHVNDDVPLVKSTAPISDAVTSISDKGFGCVGIVDDTGKLIGIITDGDLRRNLYANIADMKIADIMTNAPKVVSPTTLASTATALMNEMKLTALFVTENETPVGLIHMHDLLRAGVV